MTTETLEEIIARAQASSRPPPPDQPCPDCKAPVPWPARICDRCLATRARNRRVNAALRSVPEMWQWARFGAPELSGRVERGQAILEARAARDAHRVVLVGASGTGKTTLAVAMLRARLEAVDVSCFFARAVSLGMARARGEDSDPELVGRACRADLVVLDDVGRERNVPSNPVPDVIDERHARDLPTWVTTYMSPRQMGERYGDAVARRVFEHAVVINASTGRAS